MRMLMVCVCALAVLGFAVRNAAAPQRASLQHPQFRAVKSEAKAASNVAVSPNVSDLSSPANLPVRRVILYKSGVGYFEHVGRVDGDQTVQIDFTSGQLNDVLQSLTILDLNGGRVAGVDYNSEAPLSERLGTLRLPLEQDTNISNFYGALRGARLEIRSGTTTITGRLLSVERKTRVSGGTTLEVDLATLVSDSGEVRSVEITPAVSVRLAEPGLTGEVNRYLGLLSSVRERDLRRLTIATAGSGDRQLYVSYISEVPVWKTTYRIVMPSKTGDEPLLQGWAIVDNTVGEDWNNVELSLVAGAPQSFIEQLSQPYYARRPVVSLPETAQLAPQTHEGAMTGGLDALSGVVTDASGAVIPGCASESVFASEGTRWRRDDRQSGAVRSRGPSGRELSRRIQQPGIRTSSSCARAGARRRQRVRAKREAQVGAVSETITVNAPCEWTEHRNGDHLQRIGRNVGSGGELGSRRGSGRGNGIGIGIAGTVRREAYGLGGGAAERGDAQRRPQRDGSCGERLGTWRSLRVQAERPRHDPQE